MRQQDLDFELDKKPCDNSQLSHGARLSSVVAQAGTNSATVIQLPCLILHNNVKGPNHCIVALLTRLSEGCWLSPVDLWSLTLPTVSRVKPASFLLTRQRRHNASCPNSSTACCRWTTAVAHCCAAHNCATLTVICCSHCCGKLDKS